jgi:hypothetical protein
MKKFSLFAFLSMVLISLAIVSCKKDDDDADDNGGDENRFGNNLKTGQVEMRGYADKSKNTISFKATSKKITIDWGDGKVEEITPNGVEKTFSHVYANSSDFQTVFMDTEDLTKLGFDESYYNVGSIHELRIGNSPKLEELILYGSGRELTVLEINKAELLTGLSVDEKKLTSLDVNGCTTALTYLSCDGNQLTSLDVSKCTALTVLICYSNKLDASALNSIFNSLPQGKPLDGHYRQSSIFIGSNPGTDTCDRSIAENKGWEVGIFG